MTTPGKFEPADFSRISTYSIRERKSLVTLGDLADMEKHRASKRLSDLFPPTLKAADLLELAGSIRAANKAEKPVVAAMGAHVIKVGLSPLIIDMMERGIIDAVALNGAGAVHDMELAFHGATSEDVASEIREGRFGMVEETAANINGALKKHAGDGAGMGAALGRYIIDENMPNAGVSILAAAYRLKKPATAHVAIGTDIVHIHPSMDGEVTGRATMDDFRLFTGVVAKLGGGGVYLNIGSSVLLPEVFIKALSAARNLGADVTGFTAANLDMIQSYRPNVNVVNRPIQGAGRGISLTGHHEIMIPLLYHLLVTEGGGGR
ncbi:MAG: hypothetical protein ACNS63_03100 [Candidatus Nitrospinota bacterium M3_3B_026]